MRGGTFLFPLYLEPEDAAAADARETVRPAAVESVTGTEAFNPQRLATLIRSANAGKFCAAGETTEMDADVLNSMPKWAQAVVQTGCFNAGADHGLKPSPSNKLKRRLELQNELEYDQPRKRRLVGDAANDGSLMNDESGELQTCLDELNAEEDVDVEMEHKDELPVFSTQAEFTADSIEKYAEFLEKLVDMATYRYQQENFDSGDQDVFSSDEVKLLLQSLKAMEKNSWIIKLDPELLISLMDVFDKQVRLGLTMDVLAAMMPSAADKIPRSSTVNNGLVRRLTTSLDIAICELMVMTAPQIDRRILSEENIDDCFQLMHHVIRRLLLPCIDTTFATTASTTVGNESNRRQSVAGKAPSSSRVNLRTNKNIREAISSVMHVMCEFINHLAALVLGVKLADRWLLPLSSSMVELFALEHSSYATSLQQSGLAVLRNIFLQYPFHRDSLLGDIVGVMVKLPTTKRTLRTVKLLNSNDTVQQISTLVISMIQSCAPAAKLGMPEADVEMVQDSIEPSSTPDTVIDEKIQRQNGAVVAVLDETRKSAQSFVGKLLAACWKKSEERDNRVVLDNFVEDLLAMFVRPEWPGAEELLEVLSSSLASILHANISKELNNPESHYSLAALNLVGKICASIKLYQKKAKHNVLQDDSDSVGVVEEHMCSLRTAIFSNTKSRNLLRANTEWLQLMALKHILVMHLQRHSSGHSDSKKLLILKFISESELHWSSTESKYLERERKLWESLWDMTKGGVDSTFKVAAPTTELAMNSSLHLVVKRGFCGLFDSLLAHIMALLSKGSPTLRARVMKCLREIVDVDPMLMAETGVQTVVQMCCLDEKPSVREAAVDLIGTYVLLQPVLFDKYFDVLAQRLRDKGIKVRKSVCKIFKMVLTSVQSGSNDAISESELRRKSACMKCLVERVGDAAEDQVVKNFIIDTFQEVWFGAELSSSRLSNPLGEFCDGSTLPPGWTVVASTINDKDVVSSSSEGHVSFVAEDGSTANSVEEAWSAYRTPTVTPSSVVKTNDSNIDNSSEIVATIVEVIHGVPNLSWFVELLNRLLGERTISTKKKGSRSSKNEAEIARNRSEKIVGGLVTCLMDLQEGKVLQGVSVGEGHLQFLSCMKALAAFCEAKPQLLACHLETLRVYLKENDIEIQRLAVSMIDHILRVKRPPQTLAGRLEDDLRVLVLGSPPSVVDSSVKCLATLSTTRKKTPVLLLILLERFFLIIQGFKQKDSLATLSEKDNFLLQRALFAAGKIVGETDIDHHMELTNEAKVLKIGSITELLYDLYKEYVRKPGNDACAAKAVQGMGFLFPIRPRLFLRAQQDGLLKFLLTAAPGKLTLHCLVSMKELLLYEEQRLGNGLATQSMDRSKSKEQQVQGDQEADAALIGNVMQAELGNVLLLSLQKIAQIRQEAIGCIGALLTQGLVNPLQCIPILVALETDGVSGVRDAAFSQLLAVHDRFPSQFLTPSVQGIRDSYSFQLRVFGTATSLRVDKDEKEGKEFCLFGRLYMTCLKPVRSLFLKALVNQFTDQGSVLKKPNNKPSSANIGTSADNLKYLCYLAQIISTLPYEMEDEPLYIIYLINRYASLRLGTVLEDLKEALATAGVAPEQLADEESDLSQVEIDDYRPLRPLIASKLAALEMNGCIAFALAVMLRLKLALKAKYKLDNEKCATYKPSSSDNSTEARERSPKKLLLPSVDDLFSAEDPIRTNWNLFMTAWLVARKDQAQLDVDLETELKPKAPQVKPKTPTKRRRRSRKAAVKRQVAESASDDEDAYVEGFA